MPTATVNWVQGQTFVGTDSTKNSIVISTKNDGVGVSPSELLLLSVGSCSAVDVVGILEKKRMPPTALEVRVTGEQMDTPPRYFHSIHIEYRVRGEKVTEEGVARAIELSQHKYCTVAATLRGVPEITTSYVVESDPAQVPAL